jgi:peptide/nickel transport system ATP-binding protein
MSEPLLSVRDLQVDYLTEHGQIRAVDGVSFDLAPGEILGLAGESGSGKSTIAQALLRILPPPAVIRGGSVRFEGREILTLGESELQALRWSRIAMVFQSAMNALHPVLTIGEQLTDVLRIHRGIEGSEARDRAAAMLQRVGIPVDRLDGHAHQLSGGMRQRVGIALALILEPALVLLDEPTTALDVMVEREILEQIRSLQRERGFAVLFITHDLERMLEFSDRVAVLYAGRLAEIGPAAAVEAAPSHPYTRGLLHAFPRVHADAREIRSIPGTPPSLASPPPGCRFHPRCALAEPRCGVQVPALVTIGEGHASACHLAVRAPRS